MIELGYVEVSEDNMLIRSNLSNDVRTDVFANAPNKMFENESNDANKLFFFSSTNANQEKRMFFLESKANFFFRIWIFYSQIANNLGDIRVRKIWEKTGHYEKNSLNNQLSSKNHPKKKKLHELEHEFLVGNVFVSIVSDIRKVFLFNFSSDITMTDFFLLKSGVFFFYFSFWYQASELKTKTLSYQELKNKAKLS